VSTTPKERMKLIYKQNLPQPTEEEGNRRLPSSIITLKRGLCSLRKKLPDLGY
jgi:hypothetical protein